MFISKRCTITQREKTGTNPSDSFPWGVRRNKGERYWKPATDKHMQKATKAYTKGCMPNLERETQGWLVEGEGRKGRVGGTRWKMRHPSRQASDDTTHSQRSRALGINREFWVMPSDSRSSVAPWLAALIGPTELTGGIGHDGGFWLAKVFPEAAYLGWHSDWGRQAAENKPEKRQRAIAWFHYATKIGQDLVFCIHANLYLLSSL